MIFKEKQRCSSVSGCLDIVPYQVFPTKDGHMVLAVGNDSQFRRFCVAAGHPEIAQQAQYSTNHARVENRATLEGVISSWTVQLSTVEWLSLLETFTVPCSPIYDIAQVMEHPHVAARGMRLDPSGPEVPPMIANPMLFNGVRPTATLSPPVLGSDDCHW
jgi:crotonobetainyl-CoA:carnitine CoA-transferase CaiB-like acyl-CoA transferase